MTETWRQDFSARRVCENMHYPTADEALPRPQVADVDDDGVAEVLLVLPPAAAGQPLRLVVLATAPQPEAEVCLLFFFSPCETLRAAHWHEGAT